MKPISSSTVGSDGSDQQLRGPERSQSTDVFIGKARARHGDRYGYELVEYEKNFIKVKIQCHVHGIFEQSPLSHLAGKGCAACAGRKRLDLESFLTRAREVHGDRFDYGCVSIVNTITPIRIICRIHGPFEKTPKSHLNGGGCRGCSRTKPLDTATFIARARDEHGDRYGYELVEYEKNSIKVKIRCNVHGIFKQRPMSHLTGSGCPACAGRKRLDLESFLTRAHVVHGDRFDYGLVRITNNTTNVTIVCRIHGPFEQTPKTHLNGAACGDCSHTNKLDTQAFIARAREVHGDAYDYDLVDYQDIFTKVTIVCPDHGEFQQSPVGHLQGFRCKACAHKLPYTNQTFAKAAQEVHGDKYQYDLVEYVTNKDKVTVVCLVHGTWNVTPNAHLRGSGCPGCVGRISYTTESFIARAREVHGDSYDYRRLEYAGNKFNVQITCPKHGTFDQSPNAHLRGKGCRDCSGSRPYTTESYIARAREVHGDTYVYDMVEFRAGQLKVTIVCRKHGPFEQGAASHLTGVGCAECKGLKPLTTETFIQQAVAVHGGKYSYELVDYGGNKVPVLITCPQHGPFKQRPFDHTTGGGGCPVCSESAGEGVIRSLLAAAEIEAVTEWTHPGLRHNGPLRIDFMLPGRRTLLEFDGPHHHAPDYWRFATEEAAIVAFESQKVRDRVKDDWAAANGWRLIRLVNMKTIRRDLIAAGILADDTPYLVGTKHFQPSLLDD